MTAKPNWHHPSATRLDPNEIKHRGGGRYESSLLSRVPSTYAAFRHSSWLPQRRRTYAALRAACVTDSTIERFVDCGCGAQVYRSLTKPDLYQVRSQKCRSRWCLPCARERAYRISMVLQEQVVGKVTRFITLTIKTSSEPLLESIRHLSKSFTRLRRSKVWARSQRGGAAFLEVKWNADVQRWHPHLHVIAEGGFLRKEDLRSAWRSATGDSYIVDIGLVRSDKHMANYVTTYASKPIDVSVTQDHERFVEAIKALHGHRACATFGSWRGLALITRPETDEWEFVDHYDAMYDKAVQLPGGADDMILRSVTTRRKRDGQEEKGRAPPGT